MSYTLINWQTNDDITADKLNAMDSGIKNTNDKLEGKANREELENYIPTNQKGVSVATLIEGKVPKEQLNIDNTTTMCVKTLTEPLDDWYNLKTGIYAVDETNFFSDSTLHKPSANRNGICIVYATETNTYIEYIPQFFNENPSAPKYILIKNNGVWKNWFTETSPSFLFNSPAMTGKPTAPTASADTNTTQLATCEFVKSQSASMDTSLLSILNQHYKKDSSGLIHQFIEVEATAEEIDVQFPISFPEKCLFVGIEILNPQKDTFMDVKFETIEKTLDSVKLLKIGTGTPTISVMAVGI